MTNELCVYYAILLLSKYITILENLLRTEVFLRTTVLKSGRLSYFVENQPLKFFGKFFSSIVDL